MATIWDSAESLRSHPALYIAIQSALAKIKRRSLSDAEADSREARNYIASLLSLPTSFRVETDPRNPFAYGFADADGIHINGELVEASTAYFNEFDSIRDAMGNLECLSYVALMKETIETELARLVNHREVMHDPQLRELTPRGTALLGGRGVVLEMHQRCKNRSPRFAPPIQLRLIEVSTNMNEPRELSPVGRPLSYEQLLEHIGGTWDVATISNAVQSSSSPSRVDTVADVRSCTDPDGNDPFYDEPADWNGNESLWKIATCDVDVTFCDENRLVMDTFAPDEDIYVLLSFLNVSQEDVYVKVARHSFGRDGIKMRIDGVNLRYIPSGDRDLSVGVMISPGRHYTFFRMFCSAPISAGRAMCWTPQVPGEYSARVEATFGETSDPFDFPKRWAFTISTFPLNGD